MDEHVYGLDQATVLRRALKKLNRVIPTTVPLRVVLYQVDQKLSGNFSTWKPIQTVEYGNDP